VTPYLFALLSAFCFSLASVGFTHYARKVTVLWVNCFKACMATILFGITYFFVKDFSVWPSWISLGCFFLSGLVGLNIGDIFLLKSFARMGSARTLIIFSFQPLILGFFAFFLFGQEMTLVKMSAIAFMVACVFVLSYERFKQEKRWEWKGPVFALSGVILDSCGILLTRFAFNTDTQIGVMEGNFYRCLGALFGFAVMSRFVPIHLIDSFRKLPKMSRSIVWGAAVLGTFVSLSFYLTAVRTGHLALVSAIIGAGPIFAAMIESVMNRQWPSKYLIGALALFATGFWLILS
jgi:drug/metabolite transporter (DMT)-like permease